ncbi:MAG TPA: hypothetical protein P5186_22845 [Candidatus Paceibacterota bacterium]|nr:hypothetical protein [Verrucomicrobiota bacterium]HRY50898.1 hypothetical protein [Candidatus Paceibacterota bacterium]
MDPIPLRLEQMVLIVHHRNGGQLDRLDGEWRLLEPRLLLDSLDLAEIVAAIEKQWGISPFDAAVPPKTWREMTACILKGIGRPEP